VKWAVWYKDDKEGKGDGSGGQKKRIADKKVQACCARLHFELRLNIQ